MVYGYPVVWLLYSFDENWVSLLHRSIGFDHLWIIRRASLPCRIQEFCCIKALLRCFENFFWIKRMVLLLFCSKIV